MQLHEMIKYIQKSDGVNPYVARNILEQVVISSRMPTRREIIAGLAMQGIWANPHEVPGKTHSEPLGLAM